MGQTRVVLGLEDSTLQEEVVHFLDRLARVSVVGVAGSDELPRALRDLRPDAAVVSPEVLVATPDLDGTAAFVVAPRETTAALRATIRAGARGFYLWPEEREALAGDAERASRQPALEGESSGRVIAVYAPRGGAGATFLATNLAAACAAREANTVLADFDCFYADVTAALGVVPNGETRTVADLVPVAEELTVEHLERVLYAHPRGFKVLLAPTDPEQARDVAPEHLAAAARALRSRFQAVVLHLPRAMEGATLAGLEMADEILLVVTLDVLAFRDAKRATSFLASRGLDRKCRLVVNRAARAEIVPEDAEHVFGLRPSCVIAADRSVAQAQDRGQLLVGRPGRVARRIAGLAESVLGAGER